MFKYYKVLMFLIFLNLLVSCTKPKDELANSFPFNYQTGLNSTCGGATPRIDLIDVTDSCSRVKLPTTKLQEQINKECESQYKGFKIKYPNLNCFTTSEEQVKLLNTQVVEKKTFITLNKFDQLFYNSQGERCGVLLTSDWFLTWKSCAQIRRPTTELQIQINETCKSNIRDLKEKYPNMRCSIKGDIFPGEEIKSIENELSSIGGLEL